MLNLSVLLTNPNMLEFLSSLKPLIIFVLAIVVYAIFVFKFNGFISRKNLFELNLMQYSDKNVGFVRIIFSSFLYVLQYVLLFPLLVFFWFLIFAILLTFLSETADVNSILLSAMALIASIRLTSYFSEDLAKDLAKLLPFALLGGFIIDISSFSLDNSLSIIKTIPNYWQTILFYFLFVIIMEFVLRMIYFITLMFSAKKLEVPKKDSE